MDTHTLVREMVDEGEALLKRLAEAGFEVTAAFWIKPIETDEWRFYVVSPAAEGTGLGPAYGRLSTVIRQMPKRFWIDPLEVKLIAPTHPMAQDVLAIHNRAPGPSRCPMHWGGRKLGSVDIEGAYLYPLPEAVVE
jgi:hypothetical protein